MNIFRSLTALLFFASVSVFPQTKDTVITVEKKVVIQIPDSVSRWQAKNNVGFDLTQIAFSNWAAGGISSVSGLAKAAFSRQYTNGNFKWGNELLMRYGMNKQDGIGWRKTDDAFQFNSTAGYRRDTVSNWYHSAKFNFSTQFANGYNYPNIDEAISKPFAPAYIFLGAGAEYANKKEKTNIYLSPLTMKNTLVLDQRLADLGSFGVEKALYDPTTNELLRHGKMTKTELGILVTSHIKRTIFKNIDYDNRLNLYTDYLHGFGNIDVDWTAQFDMKVNEYVKAGIGWQLIYDDDVKTTKDVAGTQVPAGPKVQLKEQLSIGLTYSF